MVEFPNLPAELKKLLHENLSAAHEMLAEAIGNYVKDPKRAKNLAWLLFCTFFGYQQVFEKLGLADHNVFPSRDLTETVAYAICSQ